MDRDFGYGGFGYSPYFHHFPYRRFSPFFYLSPFFFPFVRGEEDRNAIYFARHHCKEGDNMATLAQVYNVPQPILEATNPHITHPDVLAPGNTVNIPRMDKMYCQKMYADPQGTEMERVPSMDPEYQTTSSTGNTYINPYAEYPKPIYPSYSQYPPNSYPKGQYHGDQGVGVHVGGHLGGHWAGIHAGGHLGNQGIGVHTGGHIGSHGVGVHTGGHLSGHGVGVHAGGHLDGYAAGVHAGGHHGTQGVGVHVGGNLGKHSGHLGVDFGGHGGYGGKEENEQAGKSNE